MVAMRANPDPFMNIGVAPRPALGGAAFSPRSAEFGVPAPRPPIPPIQPRRISGSSIGEPQLDANGAPILPPLRRGSLPKINNQTTLPPVRGVRDPFKTSTPAFLPPLQRAPGAPGSLTSGGPLPPLRAGVSIPRRPSIAQRPVVSSSAIAIPPPPSSSTAATDPNTTGDSTLPAPPKRASILPKPLPLPVPRRSQVAPAPEDSGSQSERSGDV